ncbi:MAG: CPBP family intramembrane metalloprotease [Acidobacteria bacterium]|nr:MAG: CPBP family intramembrane metalloprotease [Acidobacteriota bacterium]
MNRLPRVPADPGRVLLLFRHEARSFLRDRRTIFFAVVLPLILFPLVFWFTQLNERRQRERAERQVCRVAVAGPMAELARNLLALAAETEAGGGVELVEAADPEEALRGERIDAYVEALRPGGPLEGGAGKDAAAGRPAPEGKSVQPGRALFRIHFVGNRQRSNLGARRVERALEAGRDRWRERLLRDRGVDLDLGELFPLEARDVAGEGRAAGSLLGRFLTAIFVFLVLSGGAAVAVDSLAGEKERGTLETLLTTAATRREIVGAKLLLILAAALTVTLINLGNLLVYVSFGLLSLPEGLVEALPPGRVFLLVVLFVPTAALLSALLLLVSGLARTYKEAQLYLMPLQLIAVAPPLVAVLPEIRLRSAIVIVPLANVGVAVKEIMTGRVDWPMLAVTAAVMGASAFVAARLAARALSNERLISPTATDEADIGGGPALFARRVPSFVAVLWGIFLLVSLNVSPDTDVRLQLLLNVVLLFGGASLAAIAHYRLPWREILGPSRPGLSVWIAAIAGAPAGVVVIGSLFRLASRVLPVPEAMLRAFQEALLPEGVPRWQLIPMLAVLPAIFEELLFRGVLLWGLRRRLSPVAACLASGIVFGVFHTSLWRIFPTAVLGTLLAWVTVATGSLFPAVLWHALHNASGILAAELGVDPAELGPAAIGAAVLVLAGSLWVISAPGRAQMMSRTPPRSERR